MQTRLAEDQIKKIQDYFAKQKDVIAVYLYGSFAKGNAHKGSDLDLGILFETPIKSFDRLGEIYSDFPDLEIPAQLDIRNIEIGQSPVYLKSVISGQLIYCKNMIKKVNFEISIMNEFNDTEYLRFLKNRYMQKHFKEGTYGYRLLGS